MGTNYYVIPLGQGTDAPDYTLRTSRPWLAEEIESEGGMMRWCFRRGVVLPQGMQSRVPTSREVATVLRGLAGLRYEIRPGWITAFTYLDDDEHTSVASYGFKGVLDDPWPFFFEKGSANLARFLTSRLTEICGPLLFMPDYYEPRLELIDPQTHNRAYKTMPGRNGRTLVRWTDPLPQYASREPRLLPFAEPEDADDSYQGLPAFLDAHDIKFPEPVAPGRSLTQDDLRAVLAGLHGYQVEFRQDEMEALCADIYQWATGTYQLFTTVCCPFYWPHETRFTVGEVIAQVTIAEVIARHFGPQVLLPSHLSPVPILVQAGDQPAQLVTEWKARTKELSE